MNKYLELGAPPEKLVMGIHGAGSSFTLANNSNHGIGDAVSGGGEKGPLLKFAGRLAYPEVKTNSIILNLIKLSFYQKLSWRWNVPVIREITSVENILTFFLFIHNY